jgi:hypothetical protein
MDVGLSNAWNQCAGRQLREGVNRIAAGWVEGGA